MSSSITAPKQELSPAEKAIVDSIGQLGDKAKIAYVRPKRVKILASRENIVEVAGFVRDVLKFDHIANVTGTDFPKDKAIEVDYHFESIDGPGLRSLVFSLGCRVPTEDPVLPSLIEVFPAVNYHERETAEMLGVVFKGHPNMSRFLLPEDWDDIPPLLKAYRLPGRLDAGE